MKIRYLMIGILMAAILLVGGSSRVTAQGGDEYNLFIFPVCVKLNDGSMKVVGDPLECNVKEGKDKEVPVYLINAENFAPYWLDTQAKLDSLQSQTDDLQAQVNSVQTTAGNAITAASVAQGTANTALGNAYAAQTTAEEALSDAGEAQDTANSAQDTANSALDAANTALGSAGPVSGWEMKMASEYQDHFNLGNSYTVNVSCSPGKKALGGGGWAGRRALNGDPIAYSGYTTTSFPWDEDTWSVNYRNSWDVNENPVYLNAYVICADVSE